MENSFISVSKSSRASMWGMSSASQRLWMCPPSNGSWGPNMALTPLLSWIHAATIQHYIDDHLKVFVGYKPFLDAWKLSSLGTYWISYTSEVLINSVRSLLILYTAYLNASSDGPSRSSSVNKAPKGKTKKISKQIRRFFPFLKEKKNKN